MIHVIYGDEPYFLDLQKHKYLGGIVNPEMNLSYLRGTFTPEVAGICRTYPFLSDKRGVFLDIDTMSALENKAFRGYMENAEKFCELVILCRDVNRNTKIYKDLDKAHLIIPCNKVSTQKDFDNVILSTIKKADGKITREALDEFGRRMCYFNLKDMTLLTAVGYMESLLCITKEITEDKVKEYIPEFELADIHTWTDLIEKASKRDEPGNELLRQVELSDEKQAIGTLSFLLYEFRISLKAALGCKEVRARRFSFLQPETLYGCVETITDAIRSIKQGKSTERVALKMGVSNIISLCRSAQPAA